MQSALYGQPPNSDEDFFIVKALLELAGLEDADPKLGVQIPPLRPENYVFETRAPQLQTSMCCVIVLVFVITAIRLCLRAFEPRLRFGWDDVVIIPAAVRDVGFPWLQTLLLMILQLAVITWMSLVLAIKVVGGGGKHQHDCTYKEIYWFHRITAVCILDFFVAVSLTKMSIVLFNQRVTSCASRRWQIFHWCFVGILVTFIIVSILLSVFATDPVESQFSLIYMGKLDRPTKSLNDLNIIIGLSVVNTVMDWALLLVAILILRKINMSPVQKAGVYFVISIGGLSCISAVMRISNQRHYWVDGSWNFTSMMLWTVLEQFFGIIVASLPSYASLFALVCSRRKREETSQIDGSDNWSLGASSDSGSRFPTSDRKGSKTDSEVENEEVGVAL